MIKAIIFDVDGVLVDADFSREAKYRRVCELLRVKFTPEFKEVIDSEEYSGIDYVQKKLNLSEFFVKLYSDGVDIPVTYYTAYPNTMESLRILSEKFKLIAYSAADKKLTMKKLKHNKIDKYFKKVFCGNGGDSNDKEEVIKEAISYLKLDPSEIAIVDDRIQAGIKIGKKLGLYRVRMNQGIHRNNEYVPDMVINSLGGLLKL